MTRFLFGWRIDRVFKLGFVALFLVFGGLTAAQVYAEVPEAFVGEPLAQWLERLRSGGVPVAYSTQLVTDRMRVSQALSETDIERALSEALSPFDLAVRRHDDMLLIVRAEVARERQSTGTIVVVVRDEKTNALVNGLVIRSGAARFSADALSQGVQRLTAVPPSLQEVTVEAPGYFPATFAVEVTAGMTEVVSARLSERPQALPDITVATSRYYLPRQLSSSLFTLDQRAIESLPDLGDDPLRAIHRLPGVAASGASAKSHIRGGDEDESAIFLNGVRLLDPFHVRDYQSLFSAIDLRAIDAVDAFTGGFPVSYGDRMSGLILLESAEPTRPKRTEIGVSVFNTSLLSTGWFDDANGSWLVSARSGNLEHVIDARYGEPRYRDAFASVGTEIRPDWRVDVNVLESDDRVELFFENEIDEVESSSDRTKTRQIWLRLRQAFNASLSVSTVLSSGRLDSERNAVVDDEERLVADAFESRKTTLVGLRQDWEWGAAKSHVIEWGVEWQRVSGRFQYEADAQYFGFNALLAQSDLAVTRSVDLDVEGDMLSAYAAHQWQISQDLTLQSGVRWDRQSYRQQGADRYWSPRVGLHYRVSDQVAIRANVGRYQQAQVPWELPIEDGQSTLQRRQTSDSAVIGLTHQTGAGVLLRAEVFHRKIRNPRTRFENLFNPRALVPELEADRVAVSPDTSQARGLELSVSGNSGKSFSWWGSYTASKATDSISGNSVARSWDQRHAVQAGLTWRPRRWEVSAAIGLHSGWPITEVSFDRETEELAIGDRNTSRLGDFFTLDLRASRDFDLSNGKLNVFFELSNASDRRNDCCRDFDIIDEDNDVLLLERQRDYWLPLLPAVGVRWEF